MLNRTDGELVFNQTGKTLHQSVKTAMVNASRVLLRSLGLTSHDLGSVTTRTNFQAAYAKFMLNCTLQRKGFTFDDAYIMRAFDFYLTLSTERTEEQFYAVTLGVPGTEYAFKRTYATAMGRGVGLFLIGLHCQGALTLPMKFEWPSALTRGGRMLGDTIIFSELLGFLRSLEVNVDSLSHEAFRSVGKTKKRREWFLTYGTKLLMATGWHNPSDASLRDLVSIKEAESRLGIPPGVLPYKALIDVLRSRYGEAFDISVDDWSNYLRSPSAAARRGGERTGATFERLVQDAEIRSDTDVLAEVIKATPVMASPDAIRARPRLPGLAVELAELSRAWLALEDLYVRTIKRESYKPVIQALGYLNIYLFFYLPYWFQRNPQFILKFPDVPRRLKASVFIARLMAAEGEVPKTFIEVMDAIHVNRKWDNNSYYGLLKQVEGFFLFLEMHSEDLPDCGGFRQPIPDYAYPETSRSQGTNKRPIPRRLFGVFIDYVEALRAHANAVLSGVLAGTLDIAALERATAATGNVIDTFATAALVGFIPLVFLRGRTIPLRYIPDCLFLDWFPLESGVSLKLPQPHALNQILVSLYTGLRQNHIQWLDARDFDSLVTNDNRDFALLLVNTDKAKRKPWQPYVNFRVIEILRSQREWRGRIRRPEFGALHYYNGNPKTKWPPILPLFSSDERGLPHPDTRYVRTWQDIVRSMEGLLPDLGERSLQRLCSLEAPGVAFNDPVAWDKRRAYGKTCERVCNLTVKSEITPHSARVTVVSQYSTLLPAELIGARITGQSPGVVYHYVKLDEDQLAAEQTHQAMELRERAYRSDFESMVIAGVRPARFIHADDVNSNLSRALRTDLQETLVSYGCVSITMNEDATSGLDVLRETSAVNAAENKTEICPYGNHCPPEIIKQWRGTHRCGLCQYAVRSIDHLPAITAKVREFAEMLAELTMKIEEAFDADPPRYTDAELDRLDEERCRLAEELVGWQLCEEVLDAVRVRIAKGKDNRRWVVQKPEIILKDLRRVAAPSNLTAYVLTRLGECIAYPTTESPQIRARFDMLRRELLARGGQLRKAFGLATPPNPAAECAGLLRTLAQANDLGYDDIVELLQGEGHLTSLPTRPMRLLSQGE